MNKQDGYTLAEVLVALGMLLLLCTLAALSGSSLLSSMRVASDTAKLTDSFALARQTAIARYEQGMVEFPIPAAGSDVVSNYVLKSCSLLTATLEPKTCDPANPDDWSIAPKGTHIVDTGVALQLLTPQLSPPSPVQVIYDRMGRYTASIDLDIKICGLARDAAGVTKCRPGGAAKTIRVRKFSGIIQSLS